MSNKNKNTTLTEALMAEEARILRSFNHDRFIDDLAERLDRNVQLLINSGAILKIQGSVEAVDPDREAAKNYKFVLASSHSYIAEDGDEERLPTEAQIKLSLVPFKPARAPFIPSNAERLGKKIQDQGPDEIVEHSWRLVAEAFAKSDAILRERLGIPYDLTPLAEFVAANPSSPLADMAPADMAIFDAARRAAVDATMLAKGPRGVFVKMAALFQARVAQAEAEGALSFKDISVSERFYSDGPEGPIYFRSFSASDANGNDAGVDVSLCLDIYPFGSGMAALAARAKLFILGQDAFIEKAWEKTSRKLAQLDAEMRARNRLPMPPGLRALFDRQALAESVEAPPAPAKPRAPRSL